LDNVANKIWYIEDRQIKQYPGTYREFEEWQSKRLPKEVPTTAGAKPVKTPPAQSTPPKNDDRDRQSKKLQKELEEVEQRIADTDQAIKKTETHMAQEETYADSFRLKEVCTKYDALKSELEGLKQQWEKL